MIGRLGSSPRSICLCLALGAAVAASHGSVGLGPLVVEAPLRDPVAPDAARRSSGVATDAESNDPSAMSAVAAPSEDWAVPELLARELPVEEEDTPAVRPVDEAPLPHTPLPPDQAAELLAEAWTEVTGSRLADEGLAVVWSHWALETGRGERMVGFNFGGLKGQSPGGGSVRLWTRERRDDELTMVRRRFRAYPDAAAGAHDYVELLHERYPRARRAIERGSVVDFVQGLAERGYFTDDPDRYLRAMRSLARGFLAERAARSAEAVAESVELAQARRI